MKHCKTSDKPVSSNAKSSIAIQKKVAAKVCPFEKTIQGAEAEYTEALSNGTQLNLVKLAATRVYNESRKKADKALTERNYEAAVTGYLRPLRCVRPSHLMNEHRIVALYSGAAVACINLRKISDALHCFRRAASYLRVKKPCFVVQAQYLHMVLSGCLSYLRRRIQREEAEDILQSVRKKLRKYLNSNKPPRARLDESSFELHGEEITDQFVYLEDPSSEEATKWIKAQQEYSRS
ncbi:MAG: hypothetical protein K2Z81_19275, partial [Cyanobacteria bacterium]|nr:hypothetical protein [Cyanobacteriota bacterium]